MPERFSSLTDISDTFPEKVNLPAIDNAGCDVAIGPRRCGNNVRVTIIDKDRDGRIKLADKILNYFFKCAD